MTDVPMDRRALTYPHIGATRDTEVPPGYRRISLRIRLGRNVLDRAAEMLLTWRMHRGAGVRVDAGAERAAPGVDVRCRVGVGPIGFEAPCRVVWVVADDGRAGFAYGTLEGHPESGEESFVVEEDPDGSTWLRIIAVTRADRWYVRLAGPVGRVMQKLLAHWYGRTLRRLCR